MDNVLKKLMSQVAAKVDLTNIEQKIEKSQPFASLEIPMNNLLCVSLKTMDHSKMHKIDFTKLPKIELSKNFY